MTQPLIRFEDLSLFFPHRLCFVSFSSTISLGARIGVIGQNGSGKTSFLDILRGSRQPTGGNVFRLKAVSIGFVPQISSELTSLSGGQQFNRKLTEVLHKIPDMLILDEPTNHLDVYNRTALFSLLRRYSGTLIVASHDQQLLETQTNEIWDIRNGMIHIFRGNYSHYLSEVNSQRHSLESTLETLKREKKNLHDTLMKEQTRASKSRQKGHKSITERKWPTIVSRAKAGRAQKTFGKHKIQIVIKKQNLEAQLEALPINASVDPKFALNSQITSHRALVSITKGSISYGGDFLLTDINLSIMPSDRVVICGSNGSGKSSLLKGILKDPLVLRTGSWYTPKEEEMGYLDQNYKTLFSDQSVLENLRRHVPSWDREALRKHLNEFLFSKTEHVMIKGNDLSGGEKARLSLSLIAARPPKLLLLDEVTNNLDLINRAHVLQILKRYPGTFIVISHDPVFLKQINITHIYHVQENHLVLRS